MRISRSSLVSKTISPLLACASLIGLALVSGPAPAANGSVGYTYDQLGRIKTASYDTGVCIVYSYDANGNRLSEAINVGSGPAGVWGCFNWNAMGGAKWGS